MFSIRLQNMVAPGDIDTGAWISTRDVPMSGVRIGESFAYIRTTSSYVVKARTHFELGTVIISSPIIRDGRSRIPAPRDMSAEDDFIEKLLRESIARYAFRRLKSPTTVNVNGHVIPALVASGSDERYVDLAKWAAARNVSINRNDAENRFAFVFDGEQRIYYWGSKGIRRGRVTQYAIDIVMLNGSQIWVPIANLDL